MAAFLAEVSNAPFLALDTETAGLDPHQDELLLVQFGTASRQALVDPRAVGAEALAAIFHPDRVVVLHNASFDLKMLFHRFGSALRLGSARIADTMLAEQILRNGRKSDVVMQGFSLKALAERYAQMELDKSVREGFYGATSLDRLTEAELAYAERDVEATWKVFARQLPELERDGLLKTCAIEGQAQLGFAQLEHTGCPFDADAWRALVADASARGGEVRRELDAHFAAVADRDLFGELTLDYDDDEQVLAALRKLGVDPGTVRREVLQSVGHPAAAALAVYREHRRLVTTYGEGFLGHVHPKTGRLHPRFKSGAATSGRASCSEPNLQSIPAGSRFRQCFRASADRRLVTADYAAAELRIIADRSGEPYFLDALCRGDDLHARVATRLFGREVSKTVRPDLRARAKAINFGIVYGMGPSGLAGQLGCRLREAEQLLDAYFRAFPRVRDTLESTARQSLERGYAETVAGRRHWLTDLRRDGADEASLSRVARNMPIQGTNADMVKVAMARLVRAFEESGLDAKLVNMVHDELVVETAETEAEAVAALVRREMVSAGAEFVKRVPMTVETHISESWGA